MPIIKVSPQKFDKGNWFCHTPDSNKIMTFELIKKTAHTKIMNMREKSTTNKDRVEYSRGRRALYKTKNSYSPSKIAKEW